MSVIKHEIEASGPDVEAAIDKGLRILNAKRDAVVVEVLDEGSKGLLGIGKRDASVRLTLVVDPLDATDPAKKPVPVAESDVPDVAEDAESTPETVDVAEPATVAEVVKPVIGTPDVEQDEHDESTSDEKPEPEPVIDAAAEAEILRELLTSTEVSVAMKHMETLLTKMEYDGVVSAELSDVDEITGKRIPIITVDGDSLSDLIGSRGATLNAIQFLLRQMTSQTIHDRTNFALDIGGYRARRQEVLANLALRMADNAVRDGRTVTLNAMPPHERRIVHMTLREDDRVETRSSGEGDRRRVSIIPKGGEGSGDKKRRSRKRRSKQKNYDA
ncbi:MAG: Jag N-terminal domain-containing protein [Anaerolineae bacterium]|nr:Jag N-terminal domain-containing protein [Anaerolineae bacterium]MCO5205036.1 Jag N-terminal domain-containing protein [Anaerolineae bacterium]